MGRCKSSKVKEYIIGNEYRFIQTSSSKGTQEKYSKAGYWYKVNKLGYEADAESLASLVLLCSNVENRVLYKKCIINGKIGCRVKDFLLPGEEFVTFQNLYAIYEGGDLSNKISSFRDVDQRLSYTIQFIKDCTDFDCSNYLSKILTLDMLILNEDRHFHNLGVVRVGDKFHEAPIFDNGFSLLCDYSRYPAFLSESEWVESIDTVAALPFSGSFELQAATIGLGLKIDYEKLHDILETIEETRAKKILSHQLERYSNELELFH